MKNMNIKQTEKFIKMEIELREKLADLEHQQWAHWTDYMLDNLTEENIKRWRKQCRTQYEDLTEKEKDSDRVWADRVIKTITLHNYNKAFASHTLINQNHSQQPRIKHDRGGELKPKGACTYKDNDSPADISDLHSNKKKEEKNK